MKTLVVISHPRIDSLTFQVANKLIEGLREKNHDIEVLDLYREEFNPLVYEADEPIYSRKENKIYSAKVESEMERIRRADNIIFVFPVWWHSIPAMLKGYIDRVFNYGFAYGAQSLPINKIRWVGLAGDTDEAFNVNGYGNTLAHMLNIGIARFVGVTDSKLHLMCNTTEKGMETRYIQYLEDAYQIGKEF